MDFHPFDGGFFGEIRMTLTARKALTSEIAAEHGFGRLPAIPQGQTYATTLFIDYRLKGGKLHVIRCAEFPDTQESAQ